METERSSSARRVREPMITTATLAVLLMCGLLGTSAAADSNVGRKQPAPAVSRHPTASRVIVPLSFEPNQGQTDRRVQFLSHGPGYALFLTRDEVVLSLKRQPAASTASLPGSLPGPVDTLRMKLAGANAEATPKGADPKAGVVSYMIGNDPHQWHTGIPTFGRVNYASIYPGIDLFFYGNQRQLEYDFVLAPGADPNRIAWRIDGAGAHIDADGNLVLSAPHGPATFKRPVAYQMDGEKRIGVAASLVMAAHEIRFQLGRYDKQKALVIDPVLSYASYLGGSSTDNIGSAQAFGASGVGSQSSALAVDTAGSVYVTGYTFSADFPVKNPYQSSPYTTRSSSTPTAFVTKFSPDGSSLIYSTYLGGSKILNQYAADGDFGFAIAVDTNKEAYVAGESYSDDFPVTSGAYQTLCNPQYSGANGSGTLVSGCSTGGRSAFVTKLNSTGTGLVYSTFVGGTSEAVAIAVDASGRAYIAGNQQESCWSGYGWVCFPTTTGAVISGTQVNSALQFAFVAVLDPTGADLLYSTLFGDLNGLCNTNDNPVCGPDYGTTTATGTAVDTKGNFYLIGATIGAALPTTSGVIQPTSGPLNDQGFLAGWRGFVAKFTPVTSAKGASLAFATYLGGLKLPSTVDYPGGIIVDSVGNLYVTGVAQSGDFPVSGGVYQTTLGSSGWSAYVTKLNVTGTAILWSTFLGGNGAQVEVAGPIQLDGSGNVYILGQAQNSAAVPWVNPVEPITTGNAVPFVAELDSLGESLLFATAIGGNGEYSQAPAGLAVDATGNMYLAGNTIDGGGLIITAGAFQPDFGGGGGDGFVVRIAAHGTASVTLVPSVSPVEYGSEETLTATVSPSSQYASVPTGTVEFESGSTVLDTADLESGVATYNSSSLTPNTYNLTAVYSGDSTYATASGAATLIVKANPAVMTSPAPGSTLAGSSVTFDWNPGTKVTSYILYLGTTKGAKDIAGVNVGTDTSTTINNIPTNGETVYVTLYSQIAGVNYSNAYTYTEATGVPATITSPTPGSTFAGSSVIFNWTLGTDVTGYVLYVGTAKGAKDIASVNTGTTTSATINDIPMNGATIYVTLFSKIAGVNESKDFTYTEAMGAAATMTTPTPGSTLTNSTVTFSWTKGTNVTGYVLYVGTTQGAKDIASVNTGTATSATIYNIPTTGAKIYVTLFSKIAGVNQSNAYTYTEEMGVPATITSPTPGSTLTGSSVTFSWTTGTNVTAYVLYVGTTKGAKDIDSVSTGTATSATVNNIPAGGATIYVTLFSKINGVNQANAYTYVEQ